MSQAWCRSRGVECRETSATKSVQATWSGRRALVALLLDLGENLPSALADASRVTRWMEGTEGRGSAKLPRQPLQELRPDHT